MDLDVRQFVKKKILSLGWSVYMLNKNTPYIFPSCLCFYKGKLIILIETGYIDVECTGESAKRRRDHARRKIKKQSERNARIFSLKCLKPNYVLYYGYATNETYPHIKGVLKWV